MGTVWVARDMKSGDMQYAIFTSEPDACRLGFQISKRGCKRTDVLNEFGEAMCGRQLEFQECIEVVCTEVIG